MDFEIPEFTNLNGGFLAISIWSAAGCFIDFHVGLVEGRINTFEKEAR
jgi:hypothetical protein